MYIGPFGFVFQDATLSDFLTVEENLLYPLSMRGWTRAAAQDHIDSLAERFFRGNLPVAGRREAIKTDDWRTIHDRYPNQLSGGQRQRVALIQALAHDPWVLFADEPTGNLDLETRHTVMQVLRQWLDSDAERHPKLLVWVTNHERDYEGMGATSRIYVEDGAAHGETLRRDNQSSSWESMETCRFED